ncbi:metal-dependent hydrolase [Ureibacillus sinduriensis]|uniref:metal-dependent hydrolase n=1 Tax=Ureibacillus sinduriensis TaxID=561440 RepID=UPI00055E5806|nr:metal-dependent hydrolase [Ureibacillus sinduriensis]
MNKCAHLMGGLTAGIAASKHLLPSVSQNGSFDGLLGIGAVLCGAILGSLLPDIDHRNSYIGRKLKIASFIISKTLGHRSVVHTPLVIFAFSALIYSLSIGLTGPIQALLTPFIYGLSCGMWSHLLLDMMTKRGIPLLYPFTKMSFRIANFKSGGMGDTIAIMGCTLLMFLMLIN